MKDLMRLPNKGYRFSEAHANHVFSFFRNTLRLYDAGEKTGEPFELGPAWQFIVGSVYGWLAPNGYRRFRHVYVEMGKGNVKSMVLAGLELYAATCDKEPGAQVFTAAVTREQAHIIHADAIAMAKASPELSERLQLTLHNIYDDQTGSFIRPISSEGRSLDGKRVHFAALDELHEHRDAIVANKMSAGLKGRRQGLVAAITNSGSDRSSVCWEHHERSRRILEGVEQNEEWFAYVCQLDVCESCQAQGYDMPQEGCQECDDWRDEAVWPKTNPEIDRAVPRSYLRSQRHDAMEMPSTLNWVKRVNFCIWTESLTRWVSAEAWARCGQPVDLEALKDRPCVAGLDFSQTDDLTALVLAFPDDKFFAEVVNDQETPVVVQGSLDLLAYFWCPEVSIVARSRKDHVPYQLWRDQGLLEATPGNSIDYRWIRRRLVELRTQGYDIREVAYDPRFASQIASQLEGEDGFTCIPIAQGFANLNEPMMLAEILIQRGAVRHGGNPILAWNVANAVVETDAGGCKRLSKGKATEKIDGAAAFVTLLKRLFVLRAAKSVYEQRGVVTL